MSTDVLLVGYNGGDFDEYVASMRATGVRQAAYRDVALAAMRLDGREMTAMDVLNAHAPRGGPALSNADFLWPVITYLGSYLQRAGFQWDYVNLFREQRELLEEKLRNDDVRCLVITTTVYVSPQPILEILSLVRRLSPNTKVIVGGPYLADKPKTMPQDELAGLLDMLGADVYVFSSEGEATLVRVLDVLCRDQGSLADVPNIAYRAESWEFTAAETESNSLVDYPVDYSLFRGEDIGEFLSIRTAKSCPFNCAFCGFPGRAGKYTYLDVDLVEQELDRITALGPVSTLTIIDDTFNVPKPRFKEILRMMIRKGYGLKWNSYLRSDHVDDEALDLMRESGCEGVFLGVESGSARQLKNMNKTSRPEDYLHAISRCRELGIVTYASLIVGFPGETEETLAETLAFLDEAKPDFYRAQC
ncbi:MAG: radical SAM protein, partial [Stackebrandtia sp.]